jgi:uncharacterized protein (TIGR03000 family)
MRRYLTATLAAVVLTGPTAAQPRGGPPPPGFRGPAMRGGVSRPPTAGFRIVQAPPVPRTTGFGLGVGLGSGYYPGYGPGGYGLRGGYGYGGYGGYGYGGFIGGGYDPYYVVPPPVVTGGGPVFVPTAPAEPNTAGAVSGVLPATLVIQFPAAARVWLDGVEVPGDPDTTWTFTSRDLRPGETAAFRVRGRWAAGGRTYESEREVPLGPGARSRLVVVSGTEVTE